MAGDRSQNHEARHMNESVPKHEPEQRWQSSTVIMKDPSVDGVPDIRVTFPALNRPETDVNNQSQAQLGLVPETSSIAQERATSLPPHPRGQPSSSLDRRIQAFQKRIARVHSKRDEAHHVRMDLKLHRKTYRERHEFVDQSQRSLNDHIESMMATGDLSTTRDVYLLLYGRARDDYFRLAEQSRLVQDLEDKLTNLEESIERQEIRLQSQADRILRLLNFQGAQSQENWVHQDTDNVARTVSEEFATDEEDERASATSSHHNPLLDDYFDKAGNVKVLKGRLLELLKEQEEQRVLRNHQQDQGLEVSPDDKTFEEICEVKAMKAHQAIREAIALKDAAKRTCREHNIDTDRFRHSSEKQDGHDSRDDDSETAVMMEAEPELMLPFRQHFRQDLGVIPSTIMTTAGPYGEAVVVDDERSSVPPLAEAVEQWIESMDPTHIEPLLEQYTPLEGTSNIDASSRIVQLTQELQPYFLRYEDAEKIAKLVMRNFKDDEQVAPSVESSTLWNRSRSSSHQSDREVFVRTAKPSSDIDGARKELHRYLLKHGSDEVISQLAKAGIEVLPSAKESLYHMAPRSNAALSDRSRSSSESRLSVLLRAEIPRHELFAGVSEAPRGRRF